MPSIAIDSARDRASSDCPACATALQRLLGTSAVARVQGVHVADILFFGHQLPVFSFGMLSPLYESATCLQPSMFVMKRTTEC